MKLKKIITMGLATIMAVSAMSMSVFADNNTVPDNVVMSVKAPDGEGLVYLTRDDIDCGITSIEGYGGITYTYIEGEEAIEAASAAICNSQAPNIAALNSTSSLTFNMTETDKPSTSNTLDVANSSCSSTFTIASGVQRISDKALDHGSNTSAVMTVKPTVSITKNKASVTLCSMNKYTGTYSGDEGTVYPSGKTTIGIVANGLSSNNYLYVYARNDMTSTITGNITVSCAN